MRAKELCNVAISRSCLPQIPSVAGGGRRLTLQIIFWDTHSPRNNREDENYPVRRKYSCARL